MATGFGADTWCDSRGLRTGRIARGNQLLAQALLRRATTPRGTLRGSEEANLYGLDIAGYVGAVGPALAARALPGLLRAEWLKDDRVADCTITPSVAIDADGTGHVTLAAVIQPASEDEAFPLTLDVTDTSVTVLGEPAA